MVGGGLWYPDAEFAGEIAEELLHRVGQHIRGSECGKTAENGDDHDHSHERPASQRLTPAQGQDIGSATRAWVWTPRVEDCL